MQGGERWPDPHVKPTVPVIITHDDNIMEKRKRAGDMQGSLNHGQLVC